MTKYSFRKSRQRLLEDAMSDRQRRLLQRAAMSEFRSPANTSQRVVVPVEDQPVDQPLLSWQSDILDAIVRNYRLPEIRVLD